MEISKTLSKSQVFIILTFIFSAIAYPHSLFVITDHEDSDISAYEINHDQIDYQKQMDPPLHFGHGAVGLALDPRSWTLFVSYDDASKLGIINAKTLIADNSINTPVQFAGLAFDAEKLRLLAAQRQADVLYIFLWDPITKSLTQEGNPKTLELLVGFGAYGLALDETDRILYVTNRTNQVKYYDANDPNFGYLGSIDITVDSIDREAVAIDFYRDPQGNKYLYTGAWSHYTQHEYLVQTNITDPNNPISTEQYLGSDVKAIGIAVDQATGYVYITDSNNSIEVYDSFSFPSGPCYIDSNDIIDGPADIVVRNPSFIYLEKLDSINDGVCVEPGDEIIYTISYSYPNRPNSPDFNDVNLIDYLPYGLYFSSASGPNSVYDPYAHTVTWNIGKLEPNESGSVTLTVKVSDCITRCGLITNLCEIKVDDWPLGRAGENTPVCTASYPKPACGEIVYLDNTGELNLTWCPGPFAADVNGHEVYFGNNFNEVHDANNSWPLGGVYKGPVTNPSYQLPFNSLDLDTTYYWRIDEVNEPNLWRGGIWSFTTGNYFIVENFDSYPTSDDLDDVWKDGSTNNTSAYVRIWDADPHRGVRSMRYDFNNDLSPYYSEARAAVDDLPSEIDSDWTAHGIESLALYFYGNPSNPVDEQMYLILTDGDGNTAVVPYNGDMNDVKKQQWQQWNIVLQDFVDVNDVNLANVSRITIRFGEPDGPQGSYGYVYFEDIRLYSMRCLPGYYPRGDFDSDCNVNFNDFAIFALAWLTSLGQPNYNPVCDISKPTEPSDGIIDEYDLYHFCDDWLWQPGMSRGMYGGMASGVGMGRGPEPEPQPYHTTQELIDWLEGILADGQITNEEGVRKVIESLKGQL